MPAPKGNKNAEKYTLPITLKLFESSLQILKDNPDIITETELIFKCKYALSLPYRSYRYLADEKYPIELADIKKEIVSTLESRVMKSKDMYPGIAAMTLKNKHGWKDQQDIKQTLTIKGISNKLKKQIRDNIRGINKPVERITEDGKG